MTAQFPKATFRESMNWLHTWTGILLTLMLFAIFWMGTLTVFDREIDAWMKPEERITVGPTKIDADAALAAFADAHPGADFKRISIGFGNAREPYGSVFGEFTEPQNGKRFTSDRINWQTGEMLGAPQSYAGTGFIFPFHFKLHIPGNLGYYLVGFAALSMMCLTVTGVVIHRKIFADFFMFRPQKQLRRSTLDVHNLAGVLGLPFYFLIALSGLYIFAGWFAALPMQAVDNISGKSTTALFEAADEYATLTRERSGLPQAMTKPVAPFLKQASDIWTARYGRPNAPDRFAIFNYGDQNAMVVAYLSFPQDRVEMNRDRIFFDYASGDVLLDAVASPAMATRSWLEGFHFVQFSHWPLRWLYFIGGLGGCMLVGTGAVFWMQARIAKDGTEPFKVRFVRGMTVGSVTGIILATAAFFVVNRVLAFGLKIPSLDPADVEVIGFYVIWLASFVHASVRGKAAWADQAMGIAILSVAAVLLNWTTTGDHIFSAASQGLWSVAGMDMVLLVSAAASVFAVAKLNGRARKAAIKPQRKTARDSSVTAADIEQVPAE
ncbi:MAG: PepSY-associated TM helix domain-containing protein [Pseudomonadota bacterium]